MKLTKQAIFFGIMLYVLGFGTSLVASSGKQGKPSPTIPPTNQLAHTLGSNTTFEMQQQLKGIADDLAIIKADQKALVKILGTSSTSAEVAKTNKALLTQASIGPTHQRGKVKITSSTNQRLNVYQSPNDQSKIVAQIVYGQEYSFSAKQDGWYYLDRPLGYIKIEPMTEIY